ncbi:DUF5330 domain-containing protein [Propylenella binzhouense]|uniref:DUF5330 domain-containing protein n=1 Tax=Propylenella binzhouense TaxID=2555902 RepID=A0A964WTT0_9HYPH|nr:DUF5330 domain-containing protein [Propylenella binzhouense]MYZ48367.1 hypothetical protein [Propylenella binzhouense]
MFVLRSLFWLTMLVMVLPPAEGADAPPRVSLFNAVIAAQALVQDVGAICERNPGACSVSRDALALVGRKIETGANIVEAGVARERGTDHGTLRPADLAPAWSLGEPRPPRG